MTTNLFPPPSQPPTSIEAFITYAIEFIDASFLCTDDALQLFLFAENLRDYLWGKCHHELRILQMPPDSDLDYDELNLQTELF